MGRVIEKEITAPTSISSWHDENQPSHGKMFQSASKKPRWEFVLMVLFKHCGSRPIIGALVMVARCYSLHRTHISYLGLYQYWLRLLVMMTGFLLPWVESSRLVCLRFADRFHNRNRKGIIYRNNSTLALLSCIVVSSMSARRFYRKFGHNGSPSCQMQFSISLLRI